MINVKLSENQKKGTIDTWIEKRNSNSNKLKKECEEFIKQRKYDQTEMNSWQRLPIPFLGSLYIAYPPLFKICRNLILVFFPRLVMWSCHTQYANLVTDICFAITDQDLYSFSILAPEVPCYVVYATKCEFYWRIHTDGMVLTRTWIWYHTFI